MNARAQGLRSLDPRPKLAMMATVSTLCLLTENITFLLAALCALFVTLAVGRADFALLRQRCRALFILIASLFVIQSIFAAPAAKSIAETYGDIAAAVTGTTDTALMNIGGHPLLHTSGVLLALALALRLAIVVVSAQILLEGEVRDYMLAFTQMKLPYELAFMVVMGLHFLPIFREEALNAYYCMQLRGVDFKKSGPVAKVKAYAGLCLPMLVGTLRRADEMSVAMELRGLRSMPARTYMRRLKMNGTDIATAVLWPAALAAAFIILTNH
ncbi:MAG: energy-coupling factor transporter transmembrane protein EcfT [Clostridiales Family XIII bacterium]|jgi:energy-coupling factor transport system permease protein|nr:energy-coupling factor transporter transmembrane protein EcfT [Clostridiales Family XIII bacterium]